MAAVAKLHRLMKDGRMAVIGTLKKTDGTYTSTEKEKLDELLEILIPDKPNTDEYDIGDFLTEENDEMSERGFM